MKFNLELLQNTKLWAIIFLSSLGFEILLSIIYSIIENLGIVKDLHKVEVCFFIIMMVLFVFMVISIVPLFVKGFISAQIKIGNQDREAVKWVIQNQTKIILFIFGIWFVGLIIIASSFAEGLIQLPSGILKNIIKVDDKITQKINIENKQEIVFAIKNDFLEINNKINTYKIVEKDIPEESTEGGTAVYYFENENLKKIVATYLGESGKTVNEYYYKNEKLIFVLNQRCEYNVPIYDEFFDIKKSNIFEIRYYFNENKLIMWIDEEKKEIDMNSDVFKEKEDEIIKNSIELKEKILKKNDNLVEQLSGGDWEGKWVLDGSEQDYAGVLIIKNQTKNAFFFSIESWNGSHQGGFSGKAEITGNNAIGVAEKYMEGDAINAESQCKVYFDKKENNIIKLELVDCDDFYGAGVYSDGNYVKNGSVKERLLKDIVVVGGGDGSSKEDVSIFKNNDEINAFEKLVGEKYVKLFTSSFQRVVEEEDIDHFNARVYTGGVTGMYTSQEGIIIIGFQNKIWAAAIDGGDTIRYFTNVSADTNRFPQAIEKWRDNFRDKKIIFMNSL
ncbi:hypothetical protein KKC67_01200 [Patescibacteria group bacterium]|nr:hypothetical protein [Patescibacteria group bacterium]MBU0879718.1 hypothetical protein [Patescibacteria group bacterium]MBU0880532.1 hypothetical protein [Patescibacteria group bacterium]MBU0897687.1 hypothetical protein [Patescibacteria group bacterium]MBU1783325.1 hypothetical protein [Patescibacteria group bacterium]